MGKRVLFGVLAGVVVLGIESDEFVACMNNRGATYFKVKK